MKKTIARFSRRNPRKQADYIVRRALALKIPKRMREDDGRVYSTGNAERHRSALTTFCKRLQKKHLGDLRGVNAMTVACYLVDRQQPLAEHKDSRLGAPDCTASATVELRSKSPTAAHSFQLQTRKTTLKGKPSLFS